MTDSNKKPASATPGKPAGRTSAGTTSGTADAVSGAADAASTAATPKRSGPKGLKVSAAVKAAQAAKLAKSGGKAGGKKPGKKPGKKAGKAPAKAAGKAPGQWPDKAPGRAAGNDTVKGGAGTGRAATPGTHPDSAGRSGDAPALKRHELAQAAPEIVEDDGSLSPAKRALAWTHTARFLTTASQLHHLPQNGVLPGQEDDADDRLDDDLDLPEGDSSVAGLSDEHSELSDAPVDSMPARMLPEIAFVGRSNAGKSTAINTLAQQKRLAFASKTPGRTQHINLFVLGPKDAPDALFADLPGYGYAAVARDAKLRWQRVMAHYLSQRESLSGVVLMVDSRHGLTDLDKQLLEFVSDRVTAGEVSLLVLLTKADKLNRKEGAEALAKVQKELGVLATEDSDIAITLFSALNKQGLDDAAELIYEWAHRPPRILSDEFEEEAEEEAEGDALAEDEADKSDDGIEGGSTY